MRDFDPLYEHGDDQHPELGPAWHDSIAWRVWRARGRAQIVCGMCVGKESATDPRRISGSAKCERCGKMHGRPDAHEVSIYLEKQMETQP